MEWFISYFCAGHYARRISDRAAVALAGCLEYLVTDLLDISIAQVEPLRLMRLSPRHILFSARKDAEFSAQLQVPYIQPEPNKTRQWKSG